MAAAGCSGDAGARPASQPEPNAPEGSPERAVLEIWGIFRSASWPALAAAYHPSVVERLGAGDVMDALVLQGGSLQEAPIRRLSARRTKLGSLVTMTLQYQGKPYEASYLVRKRGGDWEILYDSVLANGLQTYVQSELAALSGRVDQKPTQSAVNAGVEAARIYRGVFAPSPQEGKVFSQVTGVERDSLGPRRRRGRERSPASPPASPRPNQTEPLPQE